MSQFTCTIDGEKKIVLVKIEGDLEYYNRQDLLLVVQEGLGEKHRHLGQEWTMIIDLSHVGIIDGSGLGALSFLYQLAKRAGCNKFFAQGIQRVSEEIHPLLPSPLGSGSSPSIEA